MHNQSKPGDWSELKRLAEAAQPTFGSFDPSEDEFDFMSAITPDVILALIAENEQLREDHDKQWRLAQSGIQNTEAVLAENAKLRAESEALSSLLRRFVENEHNPDEDQNERHWYHGEAETLLAKIGGKYQGYALVPEEALQKMVSERDQLRADVEQLKSHRTDWQAKCLKRGFEYVRESDDHYVLADTPEMAVLLGELLGVEVRSKDNNSFGETVSELREQLESASASFHRAYELEKENEALREDAERYRWLRARNSGSIGIIAYAIEPENEIDLVEDKADAAIDAAMGKGGRDDG